MSYKTPKTDWTKADAPTKNDMNRIEGNTEEVNNITVKTNTSVTITSQHTINTTDTPFILGDNAKTKLVTGLNADQVDGWSPEDIASIPSNFARFPYMLLMKKCGLYTTGSIKTWEGGVLAGRYIYGIPQDRTKVLKIDVKAATSTEIGDLSSISPRGWSGGVIGPDGHIYGIPSGAEVILEIDPFTDTVSTWGDTSGLGFWHGGVLAPNGKIYCIPYYSSTILVIDPINKTHYNFHTFDYFEGGRWAGGVLALNGKIYGIPNEYRQILEIDPSTDTATILSYTFSGDQQWLGGVLAPDGHIYGIPHWTTNYASDIFEFDPDTYNVQIHYGPELMHCFGGVLAPNGKIYMAEHHQGSLNHFQIHEFDPKTKEFQDYSTPVAVNENGNNGWRGIVIVKIGPNMFRIFTIPGGESDVLAIDIPSYYHPYLNKF